MKLFIPLFAFALITGIKCQDVVNSVQSDQATTTAESNVITPKNETQEQSNLDANSEISGLENTTGSRRGRLVGGSWDPRNLAVHFSGSPVFSGGFVPMSPPGEAQASTMPESDSRIIYPQQAEASSNFQVPVSSPLTSQPPSANLTAEPNSFEDRYLSPFNPGFDTNSFTIEDANREHVRKGPDMMPSFPAFFHHQQPQQSSAPVMVQQPPPSVTSPPNAVDSNTAPATLDPSQLAMAQAAVQAAQTLFSQMQSSNQNNVGSGGTQSQVGQFLSSALPLLTSVGAQNQHADTSHHPSIGDLSQHVMHSMPMQQTLHSLSLSKASAPGFMDSTSNKRYSSGPNHYDQPPPEHSHPYQHISDVTYTYYDPPPYVQGPPPPYHPYKKPSGFGALFKAFSSLRHNVVGTAHRMGEKLAGFTNPDHMSMLLPVASTLLLGGLALKLFSSQNSSGGFPIVPLSAKTLEHAPLLNDTDAASFRFDNITDDFLSNSTSFWAEDENATLPDNVWLKENVTQRRMISGKRTPRDTKKPLPLLKKISKTQKTKKQPKVDETESTTASETNINSRVKRESSHSRPVLVLERLSDNIDTQTSFRVKRSTSNKRPVLVFAKPSNENKPAGSQDSSSKTNLMGLFSHRQKRSEPINDNWAFQHTRRNPDGTFTEEEMNALVNRLDPVQKQFLQKLQWYGFDRWKEMPCAKYILCDVMVHSDLKHIYDLQRRIGIFLSLMSDEAARKVEVMIKDLILSIEARDCSQFYCTMDPGPYPPQSQPPTPPIVPPIPQQQQPPQPQSLPPFDHNHNVYHSPYSYPPKYSFQQRGL